MRISNRMYTGSRAILPVLSLALLCSESVLADVDVDFTITPEQQSHLISPLIYGINQSMLMNGDENHAFYRFGGNRTTAYNWENNFSSAGADWYHSSDTYLVPDGVDPDEPAVVYTTFLEQEVKNNVKSILTLPMAGYVAADGNGEVSEEESAPSVRWHKAVPKKGTPFTTTPDLTDDVVYLDELVNFMVERYGTAEEGGVYGWSLDNEPGLWSHTHSRIHPDNVGADELVELSAEMASAVKAVDASAKIFGPALYGFGAFKTLQSAPDWEGNYSGQYDWFIDFYLNKMREASEAEGQRLLDVLDVHWYSEAKGDTRVIGSDALTANDQVARLQAPRTLWDEDYLEDSWIAEWNSSDLPIIPHLKQSIATYYPETEIAFTEYSYGGGGHISGGVAQADVLGIFGQYDVLASNNWILHDQDDYISAAFRLYRNYDGNNATFGNLSVGATMTDKEASSIYASVDSETEKLHVVVLNKSVTDVLKGGFTIDSEKAYKKADVYALTDTSTVIQKLDDLTISDNEFSYELPAVSAYHFIFSKDTSDDNGNGDKEVTAEIEVTDEWEDGYCAKLVVTNDTDESVVWDVEIDVNGTVTNLWNGTWSQTGSMLSVKGFSWNGTLAPGESNSTIGFCVTKF